MNTISGLFEDREDQHISYAFIVICSDYATFGI